jgi:hypothetical protein
MVVLTFRAWIFFYRKTFYETYHSDTPVTLTVSMTLAISFSIFMFLLYDRLVQKRQQVVLSKAAQSTAIVSSLFPKQVRDKMLELQDDGPSSRYEPSFRRSSSKLKDFMSANPKTSTVVDNQLADLFVQCTVM